MRNAGATPKLRKSENESSCTPNSLEALAARAPTLALVLNTVAADKTMEDRWRGFKRPADSRHLGNEVDGEAVDAMAEAVAAAYPRLSHRYYALKAKAMGKTRLDHWDRNAPIETTTPRTFTWSQGREIVLDSFSDLGGDFGEGEVVDALDGLVADGFADGSRSPSRISASATCLPQPRAPVRSSP